MNNKRADFKKATSALILSLILLTVLLCSFGPVIAAASPFKGSIRITPDGDVEGTDKIGRNDNVYTLIGDITGSAGNGATFISIEKDGAVLDGAGRTIQGTGTGVGITVHGRTDVTIKNTRIINFGTGIELRLRDFESNSTASNNRILDNYFENAYWGIDVNTNNGMVSGNTIVSKNSIYGVNFQANNTIFSNNMFTNGGLILFNPGIQNVFSENSINGKPLVYLEGQANQVIDGANQVILIDCKNMIVQNVDNSVDLRETIQLFDTSNTKITNCKGNIALSNSHSNTIAHNELSEVGSMATYDNAAVKLTSSNNNTIAQNSILATNCYGISLMGSSYNNVEMNQIITSGSGQAAIRLESLPESSVEYNYIHENSITSKENGLSFRAGARNNFVFSNTISNCKNGIMLSSAYKNTVLGNNISGSTQYAIYLFISDDNSFYHNNFVNNAKQVSENHQVYYWSTQNNTYYSENNRWDNGQEGNYWSDYTGSDSNGDGIGETPYNVYENYTDDYPLTTPYDISRVTVDFKTWVPQSSADEPLPTKGANELQIIVLSPTNSTYTSTDIELNFIISQPTSWLGFSIDSKVNATISGNTTLTGLTQGIHTLTVYGNTTQGALASSGTIFFTVATPESFPTVPAAFSTGAIIIAIAGLALYLKKRKH